jgi:hypothetical protein
MSEEPGPSTEPRTALERIGLAGVAALVAFTFGGLAVAAWSEGEVFLAVMSGIGALMTVWAAASSLLRA